MPVQDLLSRKNILTNNIVTMAQNTAHNLQDTLFQDNFFENEKNTPIFFVDVSGSTSSNLYNDGEKNITVRDYEFKLITQEANRLNYDTCHVCCWSDEARMFRDVNPKNKKALRKIKKSISQIVSGTHMMSGFNLVTDDMFHPDKITDFVILTDGEINDSKKQIDQAIRDLAKKNVTIRIIAVERGTKDYINQNCSVGNILFRYIRECNMTRVVNSFSIYNSLQKEFVNFYNPKVPDDYAPYLDNKIFKKTDFRQFMIFIDSELKIKKEQYDLCVAFPDSVLDTDKALSSPVACYVKDDESEEDCDDDSNDGKIKNENETPKNLALQQFRLALTRFTHSLSLSIYHCIKDKQYHEQMGIINIFCNMYQRFPIESELYQMARQLLIDEVDNHINGRATTFTDAKKMRHLDIENTNIDLMFDVRKAITGDKNSKTDTSPSTNELYNSFIIRSDKGNNIVLRASSLSQLSDVALDKVRYRESGLGIYNYTIPLMYKPGDADSCSNALLQWSRILYARTLNIAPANPHIWYYVAIDGLIASMSANSTTPEAQDLKKLSDQYYGIVRAFLNEKLFGTDIKLIHRFIQNEMIDIDHGTLSNGLAYSGFKISPLTLFYLIAHRYVYSQIDDLTKRSGFIKSLWTYCSKQIHEDLGKDSSDSLDMTHEHENNGIADLITKQIGHVSVKLYDIIPQDVHIINKHMITGTSIVCPERIMLSTDTGSTKPLKVCDICSSPVSIRTIQRNPDNFISLVHSILDTVRLRDGDFKPHLLNANLKSDFGLMDGENTDTCLLSPDIFSSSDEYMTCKNTMIVDPISSTRMRVTSQDAFLKRVHDKYPFLKDICMDNVALAGGFVRSILCKQEMKDFDFFFHSLETDEQYLKTFNQTVIDLMNNVRRHYAKQQINVKFGMFFKPMFNVFELICFEDPADHIDESFDLSNFHSYKFRSLKQYTGDVKRPGKEDEKDNVVKPDESEQDTDEDSDPVDSKNTDQEDLAEDSVNAEDKEEDDENVDKDADDTDEDSDESEQYDKNHNRSRKDKNDRYYFEDNDDHGIRMRHRFQFILCKYDSKLSIIKSFDMFPSKVLFDGKRVYFTDKSLRAYQHMVNEIMLDGGSSLFKHRLAKYFKYGFAIVFPPNARNWNAEDHSNDYNLKDSDYKGIDENKGPLSFKIRKIYDNIIIVSHNSNIEKLLERNEALEIEAKEEGKGLYLSSLFCSFVSILRYVDINGINYLFPDIEKIQFPEKTDPTNDQIQKSDPEIVDLTLSDIHMNTQGIGFKENTVKVEFKDRYSTGYKSREWFDLFYKSMILTDYDNDNDES